MTRSEWQAAASILGKALTFLGKKERSLAAGLESHGLP
jgi:hypothetical protein